MCDVGCGMWDVRCVMYVMCVCDVGACDVGDVCDLCDVCRKMCDIYIYVCVSV